MAFDTGEELAALRDTVRRFLDKEAPPERVAEWDRARRVPRTLMEKMGELGLCGLIVPEEYGGLGRNVLAMATVIEELARRRRFLAGMYVMCAGYGGLSIAASGTAEQKRRFLPQTVAGKLLCAYGLSEPDVGADLSGVKTRAERRGDRIVINGRKRWCTGAEIVDYIYMLVRTGPPEARRKNLSFVLVPPRAPGVTLVPMETMGDKGVAHNDVILENVELPLDLLVGGEARWNDGWKMLAGPTLEIEKLGPTAIALGLAEGALAEAWEYSQQRQQFGQRICAVQSVRHALADAHTKVQACRLMLREAAQLVQDDQPSAAQTSMAKLFVTETAREVTQSCQQILGAYGYAEGFAMEHYVRNAISLPIIGGSSMIQRNNIANLLKLPRE